jgi:hypothetical protein
LYSDGNFTMNDVWQMPLYYFHEIIEAMTDKAEKQKEQLQKSRNKTRRTL